MKKIRIGVIGLGQRGSFWCKDIFAEPSDVVIDTVCDVYEDRVSDTIKAVKEKRGYEPKGTTDYKDILNSKDIDIVFITAAWEVHIPIAVESLKSGKFTALEVGGAYSVKSCWDLVRTAKKTGTKFMFMENCCYGRLELLALNLLEKGILGEVVHCDGAYSHDLRSEIMGGEKNRHYRLRNYITRNCDNYPTHALVPIMKILKINRGNRMVSLTSTSSCSKGLKTYVNMTEGVDEKFRNTVFNQGDVVTTVIKCANGETITLTLDTTLPQIYSRNFNVLGTMGRINENRKNVTVNEGCEELEKKYWETGELPQNLNEYYEKYDHPLWKEFSGYEEDKKLGHGGMDWLVFRSMIEYYKNDIPSPIDYYDAAVAMAITALSEQSIALGSIPVAIPDFTEGEWAMREPVCDSKYCLERVCEDNSIMIVEDSYE